MRDGVVRPAQGNAHLPFYLASLPLKNETTRREILALQAAHKDEELYARLGKRIGFGTAGESL